MLKVASIAMFVSLLVLGGILAFRSLGHPGGKHERAQPTTNPDADGDGRNDMPDRDTLIIDGETNHISRFPKNFRQRARALVATIKASDEELLVVSNEVKLANIELSQAMSEVEMLQQEVLEAESEVRAAKQEAAAEWAGYRFRQRHAEQTAGQLAAIGAQPLDAGPPPMHVDKTVRDTERRLEMAKQRHQLKYAQSSRRIEQARLRVKNSQNKIASAQAARERAKADLFDMLEPQMPK